MIAAFLRLRLKQFGRVIKSVGYLLLAILLFVSIGFFSQILALLKELNLQQAFLLGSLILLSVHFSRKDKRFLLMYTRSILDLRILLYVEYLLILSIPCLVSTLFHNPLGSLGFFLSSLISVVLPISLSFSFSSTSFPKLPFLPADFFELKSALRQRWIMILPFYLLGYFSYWHIAFFIISLFFIGLFITQIYIPYEPKELIMHQNSFLNRKIGAHFKYLFLLLSPTLFLTLAFQYSFYPIIIGGIFYISFLIFFSICHKYATYNLYSNAQTQNMTQSLFFLFLLLPGLQLVNIILCAIYYRKAQSNLKFFYATAT